MKTYSESELKAKGMGALSWLGDIGIIPVIKIDDAEVAVDLGKSLVKGGAPCAEITFRSKSAVATIQKIVSSLIDIIVGAGTVLTIEQAKDAVSAGAMFIVSPGLNLSVADWCLEQWETVIPGIIKSSEVMLAISRGVDVLKFFPANASGGLDYHKALNLVFPYTRYLLSGRKTLRACLLG